MAKKKPTASQSKRPAKKGSVIRRSTKQINHHADFGVIARDRQPQPPLGENPWKTTGSIEKYDNPWINITEFKVINPSGKPGIYGKVHFKNKAIGIVVLDEKQNTWLVGQFRYPLNEWSWEIPEGGGDLKTDPLVSARRELKEETGVTAGKWSMIQRVHLSNSVSDEEGFIFLAEDLKQGKPRREETEADMKVWKLPFAEAVKMVAGGKITDSLSVIGILKVAAIKNIPVR